MPCNYRVKGLSYLHYCVLFGPIPQRNPTNTVSCYCLSPWLAHLRRLLTRQIPDSNQFYHVNHSLIIALERRQYIYKHWSINISFCFSISFIFRCKSAFVLVLFFHVFRQLAMSNEILYEVPGRLRLTHDQTTRDQFTCVRHCRQPLYLVISIGTCYSTDCLVANRQQIVTSDMTVYADIVVILIFCLL